MCPKLSSAYRAADRRAAGIHELNIGHAIVVQAVRRLEECGGGNETPDDGGGGLIGLAWMSPQHRLRTLTEHAILIWAK